MSIVNHCYCLLLIINDHAIILTIKIIEPVIVIIIIIHHTDHYPVVAILFINLDHCLLLQKAAT